jgi:hypothetical protein
MNLINKDNLRELFDGKTISVVGNSEIKNDYSYDIDNSDIVIRFNHGALNYLNHPKLGKKIDIFATNGWMDSNYIKVINYIDYLDDNVNILLTRPINSGLNHGLFINKPYIDILNNKSNKIIEIPKDFFLLNKINNYYNFTSGIVTIMFLKQFNFKEIRIFGFDSFSSGHFYNPKKNVSGGHDPSTERYILNSFNKINNIKIYN